MKFLQSLFKVDPTAGPMEKFTTYVVPFVAAILLGWLIFASYGVGNSDLAKAHQLARGGHASFWATLLFLAAGFWAWWNWTDRIPFRVNDVVATLVLVVLIILGVNANTGFFAYVR